MAALVIGLGAVFIYVVPMQLVHYDNGTTSDIRTKARHDERAILLQSLVGLLALFGAVSALRQLRVTREGQITDRYTKAIEQLGNAEAVPVRLGGLYALERIARDSPADRVTIVEVLSAYARTARRDSSTSINAASSLAGQPDTTAIAKPTSALFQLSAQAPDVQAAVTILGRWQARLGEALPSVDLSRTDLQGAILEDAQLRATNFWRAQLQGADMLRAQLQGSVFFEAQMQKVHLKDAQMKGAYFWDAQLQEADFSGAQLQEANFWDAQLQKANFIGAKLQGANLSGAQLQGALLMGAQLQGANLPGAHLQGALLIGAKLQGANLSGAHLQEANLSGAQLQEALLMGAQLHGADLSSADLAGAKFVGEAADPAQADSSTIWPEEFDWQAAGIKVRTTETPTQ